MAYIDIVVVAVSIAPVEKVEYSEPTNRLKRQHDGNPGWGPRS